MLCSGLSVNLTLQTDAHRGKLDRDSEVKWEQQQANSLIHRHRASLVSGVYILVIGLRLFLLISQQKRITGFGFGFGLVGWFVLTPSERKIKGRDPLR